jgi:hypothetical protein
MHFPSISMLGTHVFGVLVVVTGDTVSCAEREKGCRADYWHYGQRLCFGTRHREKSLHDGYPKAIIKTRFFMAASSPGTDSR